PPARDSLNDNSECRRDGTREADPATPLIADMYESDCEYAEASRSALLRIVLNPESRRSIAREDPVLSPDEFASRLSQMEEEVRRDFIGRITSGYNVAVLAYRDEIFKQRRPAA
ncbi:MAG: hypothetical protein JWM11_2829, partial [Planctomycetaceae bacterium]|nr:hypothetical protein [Planctomycetaceae bacterium]